MAAKRRRSPGKQSRSVRTRRDNARARALGYKSYYDFRIHGSGRIPPDQPAPPPGTAARAAARGHRGTADFLRSLKPGDILIVPDGLASVGKDAQGRFKTIRKLVVREDGREDRYTLRRISYARMVEILKEEARRGAIWSPSPSLDQRRLVNKDDRPKVAAR